ncbi:MAG: DUF3576 domain-containing protein [Rickettsiales bacterium]
MTRTRFPILFSLIAVFALSACGLEGDTSQYPKTEEDLRKERIGKLAGEDGILLSGGEKKDGESNSPIGVNSFLWRATLDTLAFMPLASADPFGGVVLTDWYEDPKARGERFKVNALILDRQLRADSVKVRMFKQKQDEKTKQWLDQTVDEATNSKLEDAILTRARQLRVAQLGY